ncbi:ABC transporter substrate-binding protein [Flaviaesturariibacter flavus]|uniref:ABC transporter substrate-binding protein n=1 Tax=Flaviaesturariibacter flavus TaxID=2502780 RepID=A0A4R1BP20_9BACT|nr:ABC transporter substrate-binding protein [Flaviaesturariibacter flavus]TCJ19251.1 ABC transporter substrate-binding protein [Flaviaesturariibacter flavus]
MRKTYYLCVFALTLMACNRFGKKQEGGGKDRIVCVSKQLTEFLFALGQGDKIVGVDVSSTYPAEAKKKTTVGYHRHLSAEGIASLDPTLVVHQGDIAPAEVMSQLEDLKVPVKVYPAGNSIDSARIVLRLLGKEFGKENVADSLNRVLDADLAAAAQQVAKYPGKPRVLVIHFGQQRNQYFVIGTRGAAKKMIELAGGEQAADTSGFRNLSPEVIVKLQPDVILATDFGFDRLGSSEKFLELPGLSLTPAAKNGKIYRVEEHDLLYFGPRTGKNVQALAEIIHR